MAVRSIINQYRGVNAHLHSLWQAEGGWNNFHNVHIADLAKLLRATLLPLGYTARIEESLQIRRVGDDLRQPRADILVSAVAPKSPFISANPSPDMLTVGEMLADAEDFEKPYRALAIYTRASDADEPVAWIELLLPSNKGDHSDAVLYTAKRRLLLDSGLVFVEIDYLHATPPTFPNWPDYSAAPPMPGSHPYRIVILNPSPDVQHGPAQPIEFHVDAPIPTVTIPLRGDDRATVDFSAAYRKTFEEMLYGPELVDYAQLPVDFERYSADDQARIARRMLAVLEAAAKGLDLEAGPFTLPELDLDAALARIAVLRTR
jgi:hypothetical protein